MEEYNKYIGVNGAILMDFALTPYTDKILLGSNNFSVLLLDNGLIAGSKGKREVYMPLVKKIVYFIEELEQ